MDHLLEEKLESIGRFADLADFTEEMLWDDVGVVQLKFIASPCLKSWAILSGGVTRVLKTDVKIFSLDLDCFLHL